MTSPIIPGAEPLSHRGTTGHGVLVIHGFTGNPQSMRPLAESCIQMGHSVEMPLLPGHGTQVDDMIATSYQDYFTSVTQSFGKLSQDCDSVAVCGLSMGGTLAINLALEEPSVAGLVLVNPLCEPPAESFLEILRSTLESGIETFEGIGSDIAKPGSMEMAYPQTPLRPLLTLFESVEKISRRLDQITIPVLLFSSTQDHVVPPSNGDLLERSVSGPIDRVLLENSYHVATLDYDAEKIVQEMTQFLTRVLL